MPTLRDLTPICRQRFGRPNNRHPWTLENLAVSIARFTLARESAGDKTAIPEYADWIRTTSPQWLQQQLLTVLEPFYRKPDDPVLLKTAAWLFGDPESKWHVFFGSVNTRTDYHLSTLIASPLINVPAFQNLLLKSMADRSPVGQAVMRVNNRVEVDMDDGMSRIQTAPADDPDPPDTDIRVPIRRCDFYAGQLAALPGAPAFNPCWPEDRRDAAMKEMTAFLKTRKAR